jgi:hypothetical protein
LSGARVHRHLHGAVGRDGPGHARARVAAAQLVDGAIAHGGHDPGTRATARRIVLLGPFPYVHEGVLDHILGPGALAEDAGRDREGGAGELVVQRAQGAAIVGADQAEQVGDVVAAAQRGQHGREQAEHQGSPVVGRLR